MSSSVSTNTFRAAIATAMFPQFSSATVKFGDGGHNPDTEAVLSANPAQTDLNNPLISKAITSVEIVDTYDIEVVGTLAQADLVGIEVSEAGIFKANGDLIAVRNFGPKTKEADEIYEVSFTIHF